MKPGITTTTWTLYEARADLHSNVDTETFLDRIKSLVDDHPHLAIIGGAFGKEEGWISDDYYVKIKYKSDLPEAQASDVMRSAIDVATPNIVISWITLKVDQAETSVDVATGIAKDTKDVAITAVDVAKKTKEIAVGVAEASPSLVKNFHWIALAAAGIAVVAAAFYFAPIIFARR